MARGLAGRVSSKGGVAKNSKPKPLPKRLDKDGDSSMGGIGTTQERQDRRRAGRAPPRGPKNTQRQQLFVSGWKSSKAASQKDGGIKQLTEFIERKATSMSGHSVRVMSSRVAGINCIIQVSTTDAEDILKINGFTFAGATLKIEPKRDEITKPQDSKSSSCQEYSQGTQKFVEVFKSFIDRRYNPEAKLLDLSSIGNEPDFIEHGADTKQAKILAALTKILRTKFNTTAEKREAIVSLSLANNNLSEVSTITSIAQTFPDLRNLDLSNNNFKNTGALRPWSKRFRSLDMLLIHGNPMETEQPNYHEELKKWFRTLRVLNGVPIRSDEEAAANCKPQHNVPIISLPNWRDQGSIGENFVKHFYPLYDSNRSELVNSFYDSQSTFSLAISTKSKPHGEFKPASWENYIRKSRNFTKITTLPARMDRLYKGTDAIRQAWLELPVTQHPDVITENARWCIECFPITDLPDPTGQSPQGVSGLQIVTHGCFAEPDSTTGDVKAMRSFDRTFIIGPGGGLGGIRVVSDMVTMRAYSGHEGWVPTEYRAPQQQTHPYLQDESIMPQQSIAPQQPIAPEQNMQAPQADFPLPEGWGMPGNGKTDENIQKELLTLELTKVTGMTLQYSAMCMETAGWDTQQAGTAFENVKASLPAEAWLQPQPQQFAQVEEEL